MPSPLPSPPTHEERAVPSRGPRRAGGGRVALVVGAVAVVALVMGAAHALTGPGSPSDRVPGSGHAREALRGDRGGSATSPGTTAPSPGTTSTVGLVPSSSTTASPATSAPHARVVSAFGDALADVVDPALVDIVAVSAKQTTVLGTGMVLTPTGEVVTNDHVVGGATQITATDVGDGQRYDATLVGADPQSDVAVLQLQDASGLPTIVPGHSNGLAPGQSVVAFGNANGVGGVPAEQPGVVSVLGAVVSAVDDITGSTELLSGLLQTSVPVVGGDSGGALVDANGEVVGMVTAYASSGRNAEGFAIPVEQLMAVVHRLAPS
ncbi:MAG TPA: trypsin-like peptidase domain-containing protein [Acidimicrobiales bacterium]|nr:trypsin-like peptidase domain-containing protein [Acidimicrobiales bacterium]